MLNYFADILGTTTYKTTEYINLTKSIRFKLLENENYLVDYNVQDGILPEIVAFNEYGDVKLWWVVLLSANIEDPFYDWPLSNIELQNYIDALVTAGEITTQSQQDALYAENKTKRKIQILNSEFLNEFLYQVESLVN